MPPAPIVKPDVSSASANMNPETPAPTIELGRTWAQAARGAVILALLGCGAILFLLGLLTRRNNPAGELFHQTGTPPAAVLLTGCVCVALIAAYGFRRAVRLAPRFRIADCGFTVSGALGEYTLEWSNVREIGITPAGALGFKVAERSAVVATHVGTAQQREWLRTTEPYGEWDYLFHPGELGVSAQQACDWLAQRRPQQLWRNREERV